MKQSDPIAARRAITFGGPLTVLECHSVRTSLLDALRVNEQLTLMLDEVTECDTAIIQLLCSARKSAALAGKTLSVMAASTAVVDPCSALGVPLEEIGLSAAKAADHPQEAQENHCAA